MKKQYLFLSFAVIVFLTACGPGKVNQFTHTIKNVKISKEAPVSQGPESMQAELKFDLDSVFKANKADRSKIKNITIEEFKFNMEDGRNFDNIESFTVNFFSDANDMTKLGVINPVPKGSTSISATVTDKVNLSKYFSEPSIFLIIDFNTTAADTVGYNLNAELKVKFSAKESK